MSIRQGDLALLNDPLAQALLHSKIPARFAYIWPDDSPRVVPIWFHWNGREIILATPPKAPKLKALEKNPKVSLTIDENDFPYRVLMIRGVARLEPMDGIIPEYELAAKRYFGAHLAQSWLQQLRGMVPCMVRITVAPQWAAILDFQTRFPSALAG